MHPIKQFCIEKEITLKSLADRALFSAPYLTQIIKGRRKPSPAVALRIEEATGGAVNRMDLLYPEQDKGRPS